MDRNVRTEFRNHSRKYSKKYLSEVNVFHVLHKLLYLDFCKISAQVSLND